ncbi:MAG: class I SAM-dependent rRNA methyltransferase [Acidobacteriota bacterium]|nr:class I SAM-dependent rRNA methyltransferase [Acidobacteriota bacterium]
MFEGIKGRSPRLGSAESYGPAALVARRAAERVRAGHLWVYRSDVETLVPAQGATELEAGSVVTVLDGRGLPLGSALYSASSQLMLRMVSRETGLTRAQYVAQVGLRLRAALALRQQLAPASAEDNACRLVFSEADGLPGIVADRYNDLVVVQLLTQGTARQDVRAALVEGMQEQFGASITLWERPDPKIRELEQLEPPPAGPLLGDAARTSTRFRINGTSFHYDAGAGQKTGAFLDQRLNYAAAAQYARGTALDICTYQGGFALHLAQHCTAVTGVDASRAALEVADRNRELNPAVAGRVDWLEADAFELLREYESTGRRYDTIVLDPPAFAKTRRAAENALRGYKELNLRAMKMLRPGGTLVTCSCSHHVGLPAFLDVVAAAASDSGRRVQLLEVRGAAPDHPAVLTLPETSYLKCLICRVD